VGVGLALAGDIFVVGGLVGFLRHGDGMVCCSCVWVVGVRSGNGST
jgi:hypothetical protein